MNPLKYMCDLEYPLLLKGEINMGFGGSCGFALLGATIHAHQLKKF